jgi:hypothetical protein
MRLGCLGCLGLTILLLVSGLAVAALLFFLAGNLFGAPEVKVPAVSRPEGFAAQQKLLEIAARQAGRSSRREPVVLTEREINSFVANHLTDSARVPLDPIITRLTRGYFEVQGKTALRNLLQGAPFAWLAPYLPPARLETPVWITVRGTLSVEPAAPGSPRTVARLRFTDLTLGKQALPSSLVPYILGRTAPRLSEFPVPAVVEGAQIEDGRLIVRTR